MAGKQKTYQKILHHIDREEIISKLLIGTSEEEIAESLEARYSLPEEKKFHVSKAALKNFRENHLDFYQDMLEDFSSAKKQIQAGASPDDVKLVLSNSSDYKALLIKNAESELDVRAKIRTLCDALEQRFAAVFDAAMNDPDSIDLRKERILNELGANLGVLLEKYLKMVESPQDSITTQNIQINIMNDHVAVLQECIRETLAQMDTESSLFFLDVFSKKMEALKPTEQPSQKLLSQAEKMAQVEMIQEKIEQKLN